MTPPPLVSIILVALLWGVTNPLLNLGNSSLPDDSLVTKLKSPRVLLPYLLNQTGSLLFYHLLATSDLHVTVLTNALTQVFTLFFSTVLFGEELSSVPLAVLGSSLVFAGVALCGYAKGGDSGGEEL